ncbi:PREDICTED: uncharacterized protein LOC109237334 [Nicotiana attenuata]|uniref:uncharacterized protein LOC109237334 n=1 Tax=Nicotiana attenuata TaxID=49451 RepID=UPI000905A165|nr:PREDICTED: uncharacterized protein LOC109237334 [Nicotiana attenuata]
MEPNIQSPWLIMGDFNVVLQPNDRMGGSAIQDIEVKDFEKFLGSTGLTVMKIVGRFYTWTYSNIYSKIDKALVNPSWMSLCPQLAVEAKDPYFSDHFMICITFSRNPRKVARPFRFPNHLATHTEFFNIVATVWNCIVQERIQNIRQDQYDIQEMLRTCYNDPNLYDIEKELKLNLEKWILVEESILKQQSRVQWLRLGDTNLAFFHAYLKNRIAQNHINRLTTTSGDVVHTDRAIEEEVIGFYKGLLGTCATRLLAITPSVIVDNSILKREQQLSLIAPVTREEVYFALKDISDLKSPGCNGFNAYFFKKHSLLLVRMFQML